MGLWVERRAEDGRLIASVRFFLGEADVGDGLTLTIDQARRLARHSTHLPLNKRDWTLRLLGAADELERSTVVFVVEEALPDET